jgi:hypothetical protein
VLASHGGYTYYKVALSGYATSANIANACEAAGLLTPCSCSSSDASRFSYNNPIGGKSCVLTAEIACDYPMGTTALASGCPFYSNIHGGKIAYSPSCAAFHGVFMYLGDYRGSGGGCGSVKDSGWLVGSSYAGYYAFCAAKI